MFFRAGTKSMILGPLHHIISMAFSIKPLNVKQLRVPI